MAYATYGSKLTPPGAAPVAPPGPKPGAGSGVNLGGFSLPFSPGTYHAPLVPSPNGLQPPAPAPSPTGGVQGFSLPFSPGTWQPSLLTGQSTPPPIRPPTPPPALAESRRQPLPLPVPSSLTYDPASITPTGGTGLDDGSSGLPVDWTRNLKGLGYGKLGGMGGGGGNGYLPLMLGLMQRRGGLPAILQSAKSR